MLGDLGDVLHGRGRDSRRGQALEPRRRRLLAQAPPEERDELAAVLDARGIRREARVGGEGGQPERVAERAEEPVVGGRDHDLAVARREDLVRDDRGVRGAVAAGRLAGREVTGQVVGEERDRRLVERHVDEPALADAVALAERREDAERGPEPGRLVDERGAGAHARAVGLAGHAHDPAHGLHQRVVAGLVAERADAPERADRAVDEARVPRAKRLVAESARLCEPRPEALDEDVRAVGEAEHRLQARGIGKPQRDRPLARVRAQKHRPGAVDERRAPRARVVAAVRSLDLDHVRTERAQDLGAVGPGERGRDVEHAQAGEREEAHVDQSCAGRPPVTTSRSKCWPSFSETRCERTFSGWISAISRAGRSSANAQSRAASAASVA